MKKDSHKIFFLSQFKEAFLWARYYCFYYFNLWFNLCVKKQNRDYKTIPIIIISYNQLYYIKQLITFLKNNHYYNIIIIDNNSSYQPLLNYFSEIENEIKIHRLKDNYGHRVLWENKELLKKYTKGYYVVTDPDIVPIKKCSPNFLKIFKETLDKNPKINKVGFSLTIKDIPDSNLDKDIIIDWEKKYWKYNDKNGNYIAEIDTTFALYRPKNIPPIRLNFFNAIRMKYPYVARHGGWHIDLKHLTDEQKYYIKSVKKYSSWLNFNKNSKLSRYKKNFKKKNVSVIFVNYNTRELIINAITSVYKFTKLLNFEIIVVDNNSTDNSVAAIKNHFPEVRIIENKKNIGFGRANNKGIEIALGNYIFLLNSDIYLINNAIEILFNFMEKKENSNVVIAGARLFKPDLSHNVFAGNFPDFKLFIKGSFWKYLFKESYYLKEELKIIPIDSKSPFEVDYVSGADFFIRKKIIDEIGGFDKRFFLYYEETELTYRIKNKYSNKTCMIIPEANIVHISQGSNNKGKSSMRFKYQLVKSKAKYFRITEGFTQGVMYYITGLKRLLF